MSQPLAVCEEGSVLSDSVIEMHSWNWGEHLFSFSCKRDKQAVPIFGGGG